MTIEVRIDHGREGVTRVLLNRPPVNAFDLAYYQELRSTLTAVASSTPRCLLLGSAMARYFSAGRDLKETLPTSSQGLAQRRIVLGGLYDDLLNFPCLTVAVVEGHALGAGCVLASVCDIRIATEAARFGLPEVKAGSVGGARHLERLLPRGVVRRMALTGESLDGHQAERYGLAELVAPGQAWVEAEQLAARVAELDPDTVRRVKRALTAGEDHPLSVGLDAEWAMRAILGPDGD